jgi:hypothetical protein
MPTDYVIDPERRVVFSTTTGASNAAEFMDHQARLRSDPAFAPDFNQLFDLRELEEHAATTTDLQMMAQHSAFGAGSRRAVVVSKDVHYGMARMFDMMRHGQGEIMIFRDIAEARKWLGLE